MRTVLGMWPDFEWTDAQDAHIEKISLDKNKKELSLSLFCDFFAANYIDALRQFLTTKYNKYQVDVTGRFVAKSFCADACHYIIRRVQDGGLPINGYFSDCVAQVEGKEVRLTLKHGGLAALQALEFERHFKKYTVKLFGITPKISFDGVTEVDMSAVAEAISKATPLDKQAAQKKQGKRGVKQLAKSDMACKALALENEEYRLVMGKKPSLEAIVPLESVSVTGGRCTVCGRVFFCETRETRTGNTVYTVSFGDGTGSVAIKSIERGRDPSPLARIKKEDTIVVAGDIGWDKYEAEYTMTPRDIIIVNPAQKKDTAARKRVELHLHTNMSAMDALPPVAQAIDRALAYGHTAMAITDHGVLQSYPDAQQYLKKIHTKHPDFKIIYGVECYFVDDSARVVAGNADAPLDGDLVCFDFETTGLSATTERIIEIGAARIAGGMVGETFNTFVNPECPISAKSTELTGIDDKMVQDAPREKEALEAFLEFVSERPLIAHNAAFDMAFLRAACARQNIERSFTAVDTLALGQGLLPQLKRHRLDSLTKHFDLPSFQHHRANDDAAALALVYFKLCELLAQRGVKSIGQINGAVGGRSYKNAHAYHMILLVKDPAGLKNIYQLVTKSHLDYFYMNPRIPLSELMRHREGLLIGSACQAGEIFTAVAEGRPHEDIAALAQKYDYLEIQPRGNNRFLIDKGLLPDEQALLDINRAIVALGKELDKPVVAAGDVHYLDAADAVYRDIIMMGGKSDEGVAVDALYFRTTDDMLAEFAYLGDEMAQQVVVDDPNRIADLISPDIEPIPSGTFTPTIAGADQTLRDKVRQHVQVRYGDSPPSEIPTRIQRELDAIIGNNYAVLYVIAETLVSRSESRGYHVGSRGSVGSSFIANLIGISEVNPLAPHYLCDNCKHFEWIPDVGSGFDVPDKTCPRCGAPMSGDGHDIPFETFLGFEGEKQPDIDLNFSSEYQLEAHQHTRELFGDDHVFKAGTISALKEKTAYGYVKKYLEERNLVVNKAEQERLVSGCTGVKRTTGQHPGGMVVIPTGHDITDFTPAQHPADKSDRGVVTTHFDFSSLHETLLKLDELGHDVPTMYYYLEQLTGLNVNDVPMNDPDVLALFTSTVPLGVSEKDIDSKTGTFGIPEMGTATVRNLLVESQPRTFSDLVQVSGLSHGTDVWANNAQKLIADGTCTIKDVIGTRDSIMVELIKKKVAPAVAFDVMELTRKGRAATDFTPEHLAELRKNGVPEWYIQSCQKIKYMFPKAHAAAYVTSAIRLAWFKLYRPLEFYATYFTVRGNDMDYEAAVGGKAVAQARMAALKKQMKDENKRTQKDEDTYIALQMICEMLCRGHAFLPVSLHASHATQYVIEDGGLRLPFVSLKGVGENAAAALYEAAQKGGYVSAEELLAQPGVTPSLIDMLDSCGALGDLPRSSQLSLF